MMSPSTLPPPKSAPPKRARHSHERARETGEAASELVIERAAAIFSALGDPGRLRLLESLRQGELCVSELAHGEGLSTVSQRLRLLRSERLVERRRDGKHIYYRLADAHVVELIRSVLEHAAEG